MQTSADHWSRRRHVSRMTDKKGETWCPSGISKVRSRPKSLVADCSMHAQTVDKKTTFVMLIEIKVVIVLLIILINQSID